MKITLQPDWLSRKDDLSGWSIVCGISTEAACHLMYALPIENVMTDIPSLTNMLPGGVKFLGLRRGPASFPELQRPGLISLLAETGGVVFIDQQDRAHLWDGSILKPIQIAEENIAVEYHLMRFPVSLSCEPSTLEKYLTDWFETSVMIRNDTESVAVHHGCDKVRIHHGFVNQNTWERQYISQSNLSVHGSVLLLSISSSINPNIVPGFVTSLARGFRDRQACRRIAFWIPTSASKRSLVLCPASCKPKPGWVKFVHNLNSVQLDFDETKKRFPFLSVILVALTVLFTATLLGLSSIL